MTARVYLNYFHILYQLKHEGLPNAHGLKYEDGKEWIGMWEDNHLPLRWETIHSQDARIRDIFSGVIKDIIVQM
jgi:hypothetical protein